MTYLTLIQIGRLAWTCRVPRQFPESRLYLCPRCGRDWAKITCGKATHLQHEYTPCERHAAYLSVPGSLLETLHPEGFDKELLASLPQELLHRELTLHWKVYQKEYHE